MKDKLACTLETVLAEKMETVLSRSVANTRPRDFYDIHILHTLRGAENVPEYMLSGTAGDFSQLPPIDFWYGSDEVLYACADAFTEACKRANVPYTLTVGEGMCHCYPMVKLFPEGKRANEEICRQISE